MDQTKLDFNRKAIGKTVTVIEDGRQWEGQITGVKDEETFQIKHHKLNLTLDVSIFNVRYS
jgi:ribosome maturation factor RimP